MNIYESDFKLEHVLFSFRILITDKNATLFLKNYSTVICRSVCKIFISESTPIIGNLLLF